jgi:hypothetical protein
VRRAAAWARRDASKVGAQGCIYGWGAGLHLWLGPAPGGAPNSSSAASLESCIISGEIEMSS